MEASVPTSQVRSIIFGIDHDIPEKGYVARIGSTQAALDDLPGWQGASPAADIRFADQAGMDKAIAILSQGEAGHGFPKQRPEVGFHGATQSDLTGKIADLGAIPGAEVVVSPAWLHRRMDAMGPKFQDPAGIIDGAMNVLLQPAAEGRDFGPGGPKSLSPYERYGALGTAIALTLSSQERGSEPTAAEVAAYEVVTHANAWERRNRHDRALKRHNAGLTEERPSDARLLAAEEAHARAKAAAEAGVGTKGPERHHLTLTRDEVAMASALMRDHPGDRRAVESHPNAMVRAATAFASAIEHDQWETGQDGKASRTGEVRRGRDALAALYDSFGDKPYRNVSFDRRRVSDIAEMSASPDEVLDFGNSLQRSERRRNGASPDREATAKTETKVDVFASKAEIDEARRALEGGAPAKTPVAVVLSRLSTAIEQPQWAKGADGKFRETGMVMTGKQALDSLSEGFGRGQHRKVTLNSAKVEQSLAAMGGEARSAVTPTLSSAIEASASRDAAFRNRRATRAQTQERSGGAGR